MTSTMRINTQNYLGFTISLLLQRKTATGGPAPRKKRDHRFQNETIETLR